MKLTGYEAIEYAEANDITLSKYADPTEDAREGLSVSEAREIAAEDPSLIYLEQIALPDVPATRTVGLVAQQLTDGWTVVDEDGGRWWPNAEAIAQIESADDPADEAVKICDAEPMRGAWKQ